ncbi:MAG: hypothetical protein HGA43_15330 [Nitrospirae bacterium]|nr:hypothetical protein [Nitrospirota bacterium]
MVIRPADREEMERAGRHLTGTRTTSNVPFRLPASGYCWVTRVSNPRAETRR